jgi:hypothetical protein
VVLLNANNNSSAKKCQDNNFAIVKLLLEYTWQLDITLSALRILNYQIHQEFGFIQNGEIKDGDTVTHRTRNRHLGIDKSTGIDAVKELEKANVITVERKHRVTNRYRINRDVSTWILRETTVKVNATKETHDRGETGFSSTTDTTTDWVNVEYTFNQFQLSQLLRYCNDIETEKLWLNSHNISQDRAFSTLMNKFSPVRV